jgi:uncharacterized protein (TIGR02145 family)
MRHFIFSLTILTLILQACTKKEDQTNTLAIPTIVSTSATNVNSHSAVVGGHISSDGGSTVTERGFYYANHPDVLNSGLHVIQGGGSGNFSSTLINLSSNTTYYFRAYATNSVGTAYGSELNFTTLSGGTSIPSLTTIMVTNITMNSAQSGGQITSDGGAQITKKGICWNISPNPTINNSYTNDGSGSDSFISNMVGLNGATKYYVRSYATNSVGTAYGNEITFTTLSNLPIVTTTALTNITASSVNTGGNVSSSGGASVTARGVCYSTTTGPTITNDHTTDGSGLGTFSSSLTGLTSSTIYYVRAYATNSYGTSYGNELSFTTSSSLPIVTTASVTNITSTTAVSGGNVTSDGGTTVTSRGVCWSTVSGPTTNDSHTSDGNGTGVFISNLTSLNPSTVYYVRAYAINSVGTSYGNEVTFTTQGAVFTCGQSVTYQGQVYNTVQIGSQCWFKENLNIGTMINGNQEQTNNGIIEKYCYSNNVSNCTAYGGLYQWDEAMQYVTTPGVQGICPNGWHIPVTSETDNLRNYLGGVSVAGYKMKSTSGWYNGGNGSNESGFTSLPSGYRTETGTFSNMTQATDFWSSNQTTSTWATGLNIHYANGYFNNNDQTKKIGHTIRCIKN